MRFIFRQTNNLSVPLPKNSQCKIETQMKRLKTGCFGRENLSKLEGIILENKVESEIKKNQNKSYCGSRSRKIVSKSKSNRSENVCEPIISAYYQGTDNSKKIITNENFSQNCSHSIQNEYFNESKNKIFTGDKAKNRSCSREICPQKSEQKI